MIVNPPIMHMTLNWCFTRVLINAIEFNRCFIISSFNLATLQQFLKKRQNRRYYHFKHCLGLDLGMSSILYLKAPAVAIMVSLLHKAPNLIVMPTCMVAHLILTKVTALTFTRDSIRWRVTSYRKHCAYKYIGNVMYG